MRCAAIILFTCVLAFIPLTSDAQIRIVPKERLDAVASPRLSSDSSFFDFDARHIVAGVMNEDDVPKTFAYRFRNAGDRPLEITRLVSTCSCASASCKDRLVAPGEWSEIFVRYDPKGHPGKFERKIFVYTQDGDCPAAVLKLSVDVENSSDRSRLYQVQMGGIRLRRTEVQFSRGRKGVETLGFINLSGKPLELKCETMFLPECIGFDVTPAVLEDGQEGVMTISYDPSAYDGRDKIKLILKGLGLPPGKSTINIEIE